VDGGVTWSSWYNQPTAQFYHVATDDRFPYWVYGAQQDSGAAATPVRTDYRSITQRDWKAIAAGGESGYIVPDPTNEGVIWGGTVGRFDLRTLQDQDVDPTLAYPDEYRGEWTLPLAISPRDPKAVYFGRQYLFKTVDAGRHWTKTSPDLTRENPAVPESLDAATAQSSDVKGQRRGVIYAIALSPVASGLIWCGTDDGMIWSSSNDGRHWSDVTPKELGAWSKVGVVEASHFDAKTAYAAIDRHRLDDLTPLIIRTTDAGRTWTSIASGIPMGSFVNVVREDPTRRGLLYAGTETGVFVSFDDGGRWQPLQMNLPHCSIRDIDVRHGDLVVGTHGRSFWILDDLTPLRQFDAVAKGPEMAFLAPRVTVRLRPASFQGTPEPKDEPMAENPPSGAILDYFLKAGSSGSLTLLILDAKGEIVRRYASDDEAAEPDLQRIRVTEDWEAASEPLSDGPGMHRFVWDLHYACPKELMSSGRGSRTGPWAPPGRYTVRLVRNGRSVTQSLILVKDPRLPSSVTDADLVRQSELARDVQAERVRVAVAQKQADSLRKQLEAARGNSAAPASELAGLAAAIDRAAGPAPKYAGEESFDSSEVDLTALKRLAASLSDLQTALESADVPPTPDAVTGFAERRRLAERGLLRWRRVISTELPQTNKSLEVSGQPPLKSE
jgi:hypothetical protein